jgi:hypothetical protein
LPNWSFISVIMAQAWCGLPSVTSGWAGCAISPQRCSDAHNTAILEDLSVSSKDGLALAVVRFGPIEYDPGKDCVTPSRQWR